MHRPQEIKEEEDAPYINRPSLAKFSMDNSIKYHNEVKMQMNSNNEIYQIANEMFNFHPIQAIEFLAFLGYLKLDCKSVANYIFFTQGLSKKGKSTLLLRNFNQRAIMV